MGDQGSHRLLIVDDDPVSRTMVKDHFESAGFAIDTANDVPEALETDREKGDPEYHTTH